MTPLLRLVLGLLVVVSVVIATNDDATCVVHSHDCGSCIDHGCGWCGDGFCVSFQSSLCSAKPVATCPGAPLSNRVAARSSCVTINDCATCLTTSGCTVCSSSTDAVICSDSSTCSNPYDPTFTTVTTQCPSTLSLGNDSPIVDMPGLPADALFTNGSVDLAALQSYVATYLSGYLDVSIPANGIIVISITFPNGTTVTYYGNSKRQLTEAQELVTASVGFADLPTFSAQQLGASLVAAVKTDPLPVFPGTDVTPTTPTLSPSSPPIKVKPLGPAAGTGEAVSKGHSNDVHLSKGALAGIIIGCVLGTAILAAIAFFVFSQRQDSYPMAFRSPAAAYRP